MKAMYPKHIIRGVSIVALAFLSGYGCTCRYRVDPVRYRHLSESHWPPPRDELPKQFGDLHHAFQHEYLRYGEVEVVGSKETALTEAAKLGAEAVVLEAKSFQVGVGDEYYEWKEYRFQTEDGRWITVREPVPDSRGPIYGKSDGYVVKLLVHRTSPIWESDE